MGHPHKMVGFATAVAIALALGGATALAHDMGNVAGIDDTASHDCAIGNCANDRTCARNTAQAIATRRTPQAPTDNAPRTTATALNNAGENTANRVRETATVAWWLPPGYAIAANATKPDGGRAHTGATVSTAFPGEGLDHFGPPFGPATTGAHTGLITADATTPATGAGMNFGEGETAINDSGGNATQAA